MSISSGCFFICLQTEHPFVKLDEKEGTSVRKQLVKSMRYGESVDMIYITSGEIISKRRIKVFQVNKCNFRAYCYLRKSKRTFRIDNVLALVPVIQKESMVI